MSDIVKIHHSVFYNVLKEIEDCLYDDLDTTEEANINKVKHILNTFKCFREDLAVPSKNNYKPVQRPKIYSNVQPKKPKMLSYSEKVKRETVSLCNKINESNFSIIENKFMRYIDESNAQLVISMLLEKCYTQSFYLDTYLRLFERIKERFENILHNVFNDFVEKTIAELPVDISNLVSIDHNAYSSYCDFVLKRSLLVQKHNTLYVLRDLKYVSFDYDLYFSNMMSIFNHITNGIEIDILVSICQALFKHYRNAAHVQQLREACTNKRIQALCLKKTKFVLFDILKN